MHSEFPARIVALIAGLAFVAPVVLIAFPAWLEARRNAASTLRTE
jgi:hypothetical protein